MVLLVVFTIVSILLLNLPGQISGFEDDSSEKLDTLSATKRIIGGDIAKAHAYPFIVSMELGGKHFCGASIISPSFLVTAAHCFSPFRIDKSKEAVPLDPSALNISVIVGDHSKLTKDVNELRIIPDRIIFHPNFVPNSNTTKDNDIALIHLPEKLVYNEHVQPIQLSTTEPQVNQICSISGWGKDDSEHNYASAVLRVLSIPVIDFNECKEIKAPLYKLITANMFCAGDMKGGHDSCNGDSGGPIFCDSENKSKTPKYKLFGLVSFGVKKCGIDHKPGVYTKVSNHKDWIKSETGINIS